MNRLYLFVLINFLKILQTITTEVNQCFRCSDKGLSRSWQVWCLENCQIKEEKQEENITPATESVAKTVMGWVVDWTALAGDPKLWSADLKSQVIMAGLAGGAMLFLHAPITWALGAFLLFLGLKANITWVAALAGAYWGYQHRSPVILVVSCWLLWCFYQGFSPI